MSINTTEFHSSRAISGKINEFLLDARIAGITGSSRGDMHSSGSASGESPSTTSMPQIFPMSWLAV
jgi:hypothetical protein